MLTLLADVPTDTTIDLDSWDGIALAGAMRNVKAAEIPWWQLAPMIRFVSFIFMALKVRKDDKVTRILPGFLVQLASSHERLRLSFPEDVRTSAANMWGLVHDSFMVETPTLSKRSVLLYKALLPHALHILMEVKFELLRCVLRVVAIGLQRQPDSSASGKFITCHDGGLQRQPDSSVSGKFLTRHISGVEALGQYFNFPDFEVQETALKILLCIAPILPYNYFVSTVLPSHVRGNWYQMATSPTDYILMRRVLTKFNWDKPLVTSAVLSLKVRNSVITTTGYRAEYDLRLAYFDLGTYSITCEHEPDQNGERGPFPLEISLKNVERFRFAVSVKTGVLRLELVFGNGLLVNLLHGEEYDHADCSIMHKLTLHLEVESVKQRVSFQACNTHSQNIDSIVNMLFTSCLKL